MAEEWDDYRRGDGTIDLFKVWQDSSVDKDNETATRIARLYCALVEDHQCIVSRQAAAVALSTAHALVQIILEIHNMKKTED